MTKHNQHYVWRHYLEAWQNEKGLVHYSRNSKVYPPSNPRNLMAQRHYYKLPSISKADVTFLRSYVELTGSEALKECHRSFIDRLAYMSHANELIQNNSQVSITERRNVERIVIEIEEEMQRQIEQYAIPILCELRQKRATFLNNYNESMNFFRFISHQYLRTKRVRESVGRVTSQTFPGHDFAKLKNLMCHISAENVGCSLFVDRNEFEIVFLESRGDARFITGDQPILNILGTGDSRATTELAFYYPLAPRLACLISPKEYELQCEEISNEIVEELNDLMAWESNEFLVADSERVLNRIVTKLPSSRPTALHLLNLLMNRA